MPGSPIFNLANFLSSTGLWERGTRPVQERRGCIRNHHVLDLNQLSRPDTFGFNFLVDQTIESIRAEITRNDSPSPTLMKNIILEKMNEFIPGSDKLITKKNLIWLKDVGDLDYSRLHFLLINRIRKLHIEGLDKDEKQRLYRKFYEAVVDPTNPLPKGIKSYCIFSDFFFNGYMHVAYKDMNNIVCKALGKDFGALEWGNQYNGTSKEYRAKLKEVERDYAKWVKAEALGEKQKYSEADLEGSLKGLWGYIASAEVNHGGSMQKAYKEMSAVCKALGKDFGALEWGNQYNGTSKEYRAKLKEVERDYAKWVKAEALGEKQKYSEVDLEGSLKGLWGYIASAEVNHGGSMQKTYTEMSAVCKALGKDFEALEWGNQYNGTSKEYRAKLKEVEKDYAKWVKAEALGEKQKYSEADLEGSLKGLWGYIASAEVNHGGSMQKAYKEMSAVCKALGKDFEALEWGNNYLGTSKEYRAKLKEVEKDYTKWIEGGVLRKKQKYSEADLEGSLKGLWGYIASAEVNHGGSMQKAYKEMSAVCKALGKDFGALEWGNNYSGTSKEYRAKLKEVERDYAKWVKAEALGEKQKYSEADLEGSLKGLWGYIASAEVNHGGSMQKAYKEMSAVCKALGKDFGALEWGNQYYGTSKEYRAKLKEVERDYAKWVKAEALGEKQKYSEVDLEGSLKGLWGYIASAEVNHGGSMSRTYTEMSAVCKALGKDFEALEWGNQYNGTSKEYRAKLKEVEKDYTKWIEGGVLRKKQKYSEADLEGSLKGLWGYIASAEVNHGGSMSRTYTEMSAVCKALGKDFGALEWGSNYPGTSKEYRAKLKEVERDYAKWVKAEALGEKQKYSEADLEGSLKGLWGYIASAEVNHGGSMQKAYIEMSAVCKALGKDFGALEWGNQYNGTSTEYRAKQV